MTPPTDPSKLILWLEKHATRPLAAAGIGLGAVFIGAAIVMYLVGEDSAIRFLYSAVASLMIGVPCAFVVRAREQDFKLATERALTEAAREAHRLRAGSSAIGDRGQARRRALEAKAQSPGDTAK